jgi:tripartite-type tricarboxylate transporter receptor subunit TctC
VRAGTPALIVAKLNQEIMRVLDNRDFQAKLLAAGVEPVGSTPAQFAQLIRSDMEKWGRLIKEGGIRND